MLPTKGYFKDIECPYNETSCWRPFCHFRHKRKQPESTSEASDVEKDESTGGVPTYKPTPKSELAIIHNKSHIPISYVPDVVYGGANKKPRATYNPTPLSILSSANRRLSYIYEENGEHIDTIKEIKQNIAETEYVPTVAPAKDIDFEALSTEFDLIDEIIKSDDKTGKKSKSSDDKKKVKSSSVKGKSSDKSDKSDKKKSKSSSEKETKTKKSDKQSSKEKHEKSSKSNKEKSDSENKHKSKDKKSDKDKEKKSSSTSTSKETHKSSGKSKTEKAQRQSRDVKKKSKSDDSHRKKSRSKERKKSEKRNKSDSSDQKSKKPKIVKEDSDQDNNIAELNDISDIELEFEEEEDTMMECFKIFNEYKPPTPQPEPTCNIPQKIDQSSNHNLVETSVIKKRIAHHSENAPSQPLIPVPSKLKSIPKPGQTLTNRYKIALAAQAEKEPELIVNEVKLAPLPPAKKPMSLIEAARARKLEKELEKRKLEKKQSTNLVEDILKGTTKPVKIAPVLNISLLTKAKERLSTMVKPPIKTIAHTQKGTRVAHIPEVNLSNLPDVLQADKSKLPVNVRTRFLTLIAEECCKLYISKEEAHNRALNEEFYCYEKCKVLATYRNSAMLAVNRLRKEVQERASAGLGLIGEGEGSATASGGSKNSSFYSKVKKWILTDEELDLHGYPREADKHGRAVIKNFKPQQSGNLDENQRQCVRCKKIYQVDDDGWPLFDEECIYHPLKKRTIRGEQNYLCCRSNVEGGCCMSDTHVSEGFAAELEGFQSTIRPESENDPRSLAVYALDCEMCYTTKGLELTRVTIIDTDCKTVYESLVKPLNPIIDYNTKFSGITKEQMDRTSTSILQVQANILHLCNSKTILVGHSLESDMKALKICHSTIIDTAVLFPHKMGLPHKKALRTLASEYLRKIIQNDVSGHDSAEDAVTCMELLKWKLKDEAKGNSSSELVRRKV